MKLSAVLLSALAAATTAHGQHFAERRANSACTPGNNCQRGITGTNGKPAVTSRLADCSALNTVTVVAPTTTTTVTTTETRVQVPTSVKARRTAVPAAEAIKRQESASATFTTLAPTVVPAYATYCPSAAVYYSACSCAGITAATTTTTPTATETATVTVCPAARLVKKAAQGLGYEIADDWDEVGYDGIALIKY